MKCYCCSGLEYDQCCQKFLEGNAIPSTPEELMRSRYAAYCVLNFQYIVDTYATSVRKEITLQDIEASAQGTRWTALNVVSSESSGTKGQVQFKAFYRLSSSFYVLHELSDFVKEGNRWFYSTGIIQEDSGELKVQRNSPCPCLSQLKYKRCCGK
ncbi:nucleic acid-binding protein [Alteromonadaceae bacterium M269]|nr:nucleic acid-binding protein [Alteromonadaceae bacterium M269]